MSSNFVSKTLIDVLVTAAVRWRLTYFWRPPRPGSPNFAVTAKTADSTGSMLWRTSWEATMEWWADQEGCPYPEPPTYTYDELPGEPNPLLILSATSYYGYNTADEEPADWQARQAYAFRTWLDGEAIRRLPGIKAIPWEIGDDDRDIFTRYPPEPQPAA
jgi:hypothetical protein